MTVGYKERVYSLPISCEVYRNLQTGSLSVRAKEGKHKGKVIDHISEVHLNDCEFHVNESGRQRVIENQRKNVHATVKGTLVDSKHKISNGINIIYNPYKFSEFVTEDTHSPVTTAEQVHIEVCNETVSFTAQNIS